MRTKLLALQRNGHVLKKLSAAAMALGAAAGAHAQSSVTVFGVIDVSVSRGSGSTGSVTGLRSGSNFPSNIGFRGVEDLGDGLKAGFWLEADINVDNGTGGISSTNNQASGLVSGGGLTWGRRSIVSFGGPWGQFFLGRDYNPTFWNNGPFDPFGINGAGTSQAFLSRFVGGGPLSAATAAYWNGGSGLYSRASNSIAYAYGYAPNGQTSVGTGGLYAHLMYFFGENASNAANKKDGTGAGARVGYVAGPLNVAAAYMHSQFEPTNLATVTPATFGSVSLGDITTWSLAGSYDFGVVKPRAMMVRDKFGPRSGKGWMVGATAPFGVSDFKLAFSGYETSLDARSFKIAVGHVYNLSKRTVIYETYARVRNSGGAAQAINGATTALNRPSSGIDIGIRHNF